ncbi:MULTISPECIES: class I SAM-dependent methyltransferase [Salinibaculum]|uniref:class I SAM-dependent methyltransferase n=1 Tax=Salinibaculum TaxID=2732368 RepID=UPI0036082A30
MRQFTAEYLDATREGMWEDSRAALAPLELGACERVLDVGAGTGELTRVLREESPGQVVALDADAGLLAEVTDPRVRGDATRLPFPDDAFDLVVCQALLVNLPDPAAAVREFARVSRDRVAAIEPDNSAVTIESTVEAEAPLARRARGSYLDGVETNAALGAARELFADAGLADVTVRSYDHERTIEPPYTETALTAARRKASGEGLGSDRETMLAGETTPEEFDALRQEWRAMGRTVIEQMQAGEYRQREVVPFYVTVGTVE